MHAHAHVESTEDLSNPVIQDWNAYTAADHEVWQILYAKRMRELESTASDVFLRGAEIIGLSPEHIPNLAEVNRRLRRRTGWSAVPVDGFLPAREFFASLAERRFPTTVTIRAKESVDYVPEPDIFHDVFGHVPLHSDPAFAGFLQKCGKVANNWNAKNLWSRHPCLVAFTEAIRNHTHSCSRNLFKGPFHLPRQEWYCAEILNDYLSVAR